MIKMSGRQLSCSYCCYSTRFFDFFVEHYKNEHASTSNLVIACGVKDCYSQYSNIHSLRKHHQRKHKDSLLIQDNLDPIEENKRGEEHQVQLQVHENIASCDEGEIELDPQIDEERHTIGNNIPQDISRPFGKSLMKFLINTREKLNVSQNASVCDS